MSESRAWRKSSFSDVGAANCVEVALHDTCVLVRDSVHPSGTVLHFGPARWQEFVDHMATGQPD
ncbi:DUF397 domain-containing protein [Streptomyces fructofermentans]|uniref:DUF397 domain-containing protein n=1 Tax=Streptomyces fructofermentans TaxID=152141 RepID=UPI00378F2981